MGVLLCWLHGTRSGLRWRFARPGLGGSLGRCCGLLRRRRCFPCRRGFACGLLGDCRLCGWLGRCLAGCGLLALGGSGHALESSGAWGNGLTLYGVTLQAAMMPAAQWGAAPASWECHSEDGKKKPAACQVKASSHSLKDAMPILGGDICQIPNQPGKLGDKPSLRSSQRSSLCSILQVLLSWRSSPRPS